MAVFNVRQLTVKAARALGYLAAFFVIAAIINKFQSPDTKAMPPVSSLELATLTGEKAQINTAAGKKTIVYFFAPWCTVCRAEAPDVTATAADFDGQVQVIGVAGRGEVFQLLDEDAVVSFVVGPGRDVARVVREAEDLQPRHPRGLLAQAPRR